MIGPAGFMRAPNTHEGRPAPRTPLEQWETIRLSDMWENKRSGTIVSVEQTPDGMNGGVCFRNLKSRRLSDLPAYDFLKRYEQKFSGPGPYGL